MATTATIETNKDKSKASANTGMPKTSGVGKPAGNGDKGNGNGKGHKPDVKINKANGKVEPTKAEIKGLVLAGKAYDKNWKSGWTMGKRFQAAADKTGQTVKALHRQAHEERMVEVRAELHEFYNGNKPQIDEALTIGRFFPSYEQVNKSVQAFKRGMNAWGGPPTNIVQEARFKANLWTSKAAKKLADELEAKERGEAPDADKGNGNGADTSARVAFEEHIFKAVRSIKRTKEIKGIAKYDRLLATLREACKREGLSFRNK